MPQNQGTDFIGRLGKHSARKDHRTLNLSNYIRHNQLPNVPVIHDWTKKKKGRWGMMENLNISNCTCAAAGHMIQTWTANTTKEIIIANKAVVDAYIVLSGYDPKTGANDNGVCAIDALKYWRKNGIGNHKIKAFATIDLKDHKTLRNAIYFFGGVYVGMQLPKTIVGQDIWEVKDPKLKGKAAVGSLGGHAVTVLAYDDTHLTCVSWGREKKMTWEFWNTYCDEVYAIITEDFFKNNKNAAGLSLHELEKDLMIITGQKITLDKQLKENRSKYSQPNNIEMPTKKTVKKQTTKSGKADAVKPSKAIKKTASKKGEPALASSGTRGRANAAEAGIVHKNSKKPLAKSGKAGGIKAIDVIKKVAPKKAVASSSAKGSISAKEANTASNSKKKSLSREVVAKAAKKAVIKPAKATMPKKAATKKVTPKKKTLGNGGSMS